MDLVLLALRTLSVILLYAFLGAVLVMLWRDLRRASDIREAARPMAELVTVETGSNELAPGHRFVLQLVTSIGRSQSNLVSVPDPYSSAEHALLAWRQGQWWLQDQGSHNGTLLNGTRIEGPTVVSSGDVIGVGNTQLKLEIH